MIPQFTIRLICGLATMWTVAPKPEITSGFFRIQHLLALGLSVLLAVTVNQLTSGPAMLSDRMATVFFALGMILAFCSFLGSLFWTLERRIAGGWTAALICILSSTGVILHGMSGGQSAHGLQSTLVIWDALSAAWLTGGVIATMLLGHWYLTAIGMKLTPLVQYTWILLGAVVVRIAVVGVQSLLFPSSLSSSWTVSMTILRWAGLLGPLVLTVLTLRILRYRNTQSATGVLYAAAALVFLGEMAASLLAGAREIAAGV